MSNDSTSIVWFRQDLRLEDNPALHAARGGPIVPVYIWSPEEERAWPPGTASRWWLRASLESLDQGLRARGSRLILRRGPAAEAISDLARVTGARAIYWNRRYEPAARAQETKVRNECGLPCFESNGSLLFDPERIRTRGGLPFRVFTPFWRACLQQDAPALPLPAPREVSPPSHWPRSLPRNKLIPGVERERSASLQAFWDPGEGTARARLRGFLRRALMEYPDRRDFPAIPGTSRLSPHLHHGEISPRQVWHAVARQAARDPRPGSVAAREAYLRQLGWREFAYHLLYHFPHTPEAPLRDEYAGFPWRTATSELAVWREGRTGYGLVDAGMRELLRSGWMHNRSRMVTASFLVKHLLLPWTAGARWFWENLVDADLANNTLGWQWVAGCGADATPYFRVFNPIVQAERFDPEGEYRRRWIEKSTGSSLVKLSKAKQSKATPFLVDHAAARSRALAAFAAMKSRPTNTGETP